MTTPLVLYHSDADGFGAAYACWTIFGDDAEYVPVNYGDDPPGVTARDVYIVDFSFPRDTLIAMNEATSSLVVIDHHKTAEADLAGLPFCHFNQDASGCTATWQYMHCVHDGALAPDFLMYVQDRDLWRWELPHSREVNAAIASYPQDFLTWDYFDVGVLISEGCAILRYQEQLVAEHVKRARPSTILGHTVPTVNATVLQSEIGNALCRGKPFAAMWSEVDGIRTYSLRSDESGEDVSSIARNLGGGGHVHAAGFRSGGPMCPEPQGGEQ